MKMNSGLYNQLKSDIEAVINKAEIDLPAMVDRLKNCKNPGLAALYKIKSVVDHDRAYDDNHPTYKVRPRFLPYTGRDYCHLYNYGLNDTHIETALKRIYKEIQ